MCLHFGHGITVNELHLKASSSFRTRNTCPDTETVLRAFLQTYSEESVILHCRTLLVMARVLESYIMGVALERTVILHFQTTGYIPALKSVIRELERPVLHELRIKTAICGKVYILDEDTVHRRLDFRTDIGEIDLHSVDLSQRGNSGRQRDERKHYPFHNNVYTKALFNM